MPALVAGIHVFATLKTWMAGTWASEATPFSERLCPAMTVADEEQIPPSALVARVGAGVLV
jgi:hypothetical protein